MRISKRGPTPGFEQDLLASEPKLTHAAALCLEAWMRLDSERPVGFAAAGKIPYRAITAWAEREHLTEENTTLVILVLERLDNERMDRLATEARSNGT